VSHRTLGGIEPRFGERLAVVDEFSSEGVSARGGSLIDRHASLETQDEPNAGPQVLRPQGLPFVGSVDQVAGVEDDDRQSTAGRHARPDFDGRQRSAFNSAGILPNRIRRGS
jgi:hypothetical protein